MYIFTLYYLYYIYVIYMMTMTNECVPMTERPCLCVGSRIFLLLRSVQAGGVRKVHQKTRKLSGFNAFQRECGSLGEQYIEFNYRAVTTDSKSWLRHRYRGNKVAAAPGMHRTLGEEWKNLSQEERARYVAKAAEMQADRKKLQTKALDDRTAGAEAESSHLSAAQVKRLNNARLDCTLDAYSKHPAWSSGLSLSDHICALKASLVLPLQDADKEQMRVWKEQFEFAFGYDANIVQNNESMPSFLRACYATNGGLCQQQPNFQVLKRVMGKFHDAIQTRKLGAEPFLLHMAVDGPAASGRSQYQSWIIVAGVCQRPMCHSVVHLHCRDGRLHFSVRNANLHVGTMHRAVNTALAYQTSSGEPADGVSLCVTSRVSFIRLMRQPVPDNDATFPFDLMGQLFHT